MPERDPPLPSVPESRAVPKKRTRLSLVWVIPIVAALVGVWVAVTRILSEGPKITIVFQSAEGLEAGKTKINYQRGRYRDRHGDPAIGGPRAGDHHGADDAEDRGLPGQGHAVLGGAAADLGSQRDRAGNADLGGLYRAGNRRFEGAEARLRGARDAADCNRRSAGAVLRAEDPGPGFAGYRHADIFPPAAGGAGGLVHAGQGRQVPDAPDIRARALRSVRQPEHAFLACQRDRRVAFGERAQRADPVAAVDPDRRHRLRDPGQWSGAARGRGQHGLHAVQRSDGGLQAGRPQIRRLTS